MSGKIMVLFMMLMLWPVTACAVTTPEVIPEAGAPETAAPVAAPEYKDGDEWLVRYKRTSTIYRSIALPSGDYRVVYKNGTFEWYTAGTNTDPWTGLLRDAPFFVGKYPKIPFYVFPLRPEQPRGYKYFNENVGRRGTEMEGTVTVIFPGKIILTTAGEMEAYQHVLEEWGGGVTRRYEYFYAPGCKVSIMFKAEIGTNDTYSGEVLSCPK